MVIVHSSKKNTWLSFLCSLEYNEFWVEILHAYRSGHYLHLIFLSRFLETKKSRFWILWIKELHVAGAPFALFDFLGLLEHLQKLRHICSQYSKNCFSFVLTSTRTTKQLQRHTHQCTKTQKSSNPKFSATGLAKRNFVHGKSQRPRAEISLVCRQLSSRLWLPNLGAKTPTHRLQLRYHPCQCPTSPRWKNKRCLDVA